MPKVWNFAFDLNAHGVDFQLGCGDGALVTDSCPTLVTPWTVACWAPLSIGCIP